MVLFVTYCVKTLDHVSILYLVDYIHSITYENEMLTRVQKCLYITLCLSEIVCSCLDGQSARSVLLIYVD